MIIRESFSFEQLDNMQSNYQTMAVEKAPWELIAGNLQKFKPVRVWYKSDIVINDPIIGRRERIRPAV